MNDLTQARKLIKECKDTQNPYLDLGNCGITDFNKLPELFECVHLETLILSSSWCEGNIWRKSCNNGIDNIISYIPYKISKLKKLKKLIAGSSHRDLINLSDISFLEKLTTLQTLDLRNNQISDISILEKLTRLESLDLYCNEISDISFLGKLTALQSLNLRKNNIFNISSLENLTELKSLDLGNNYIFFKRISFEKLTALQSLKLSNTLVIDIGFLEKLTTLQSLDLESNKISDISFLGKLTALQSINLSFNKIFDISILEKLTALKSLNLSGNKISDISSLEKLTALQSLKLSNTLVIDISFLEKFTALQSLDLSFNKIFDISSLEKLTALQSLNLNGNKISDISILEKLTALKSLNLYKNQISNISILEKLTALQSLNLSSNQISNISSLEKLTALQSLNLSSNRIKIIQEHLFKLKMEVYIESGYRSYALNLYNNPIESLPIEIIKQGRQSVLDWFEAKKKKLNEIKIILIGEPKAGKTSLIKRLKDNKFNENEVQTDGVNIVNIAFGASPYFKKQTSLHNITGHFWDFGGQEIMNATHQFFLTKRSVYVLVLDARKDANSAVQIRDWVMRVRATGGDSPMIIVANQIDSNPGFGFTNEHDLQNEFPQIKCFIKLSCKTEENLDLFKEKLAELIPTAELFNTEIDERWIKIKNKLQEETKYDHFLNERQFQTICSEFDLKKKREQKNAIKFLHDLGLVLHFEELNLTDYYVLNPYWITYGVYQILTSIYAGNEKGIVGIDKLEFIVNEEEDKKDIYRSPDYQKITYTTTERNFLIDILHYFKLCFCVADRSQFIIPDLLDTTEPLQITEPVKLSDDNIRFMYQYDYLPKSIMPNIMVETHSIVNEKWRTGCVLEKDGCKAIISSYEKRITVIVTGEHKKKRGFLAVIRHNIDSINANLTNKPRMLIPLQGIENVESYPDYEELLEREKDGEEYYTIYKPEKKRFKISELLEGIPTEDEIKRLREEMKEFREETIEKLNDIRTNQDKMIEAIEEMTAQQTTEVSNEIMTWITTAIGELDGEMDDRLREMYNNIKKTDDLQVKLKLSIPFIKLLGVDLSAEFNIKNWSKKMYEKHELKLFKLMGLL